MRQCVHMQGFEKCNFLRNPPAYAEPLPHAAVVVLLLLLLPVHGLSVLPRRVIAALLRGIAPAPSGIARRGVSLRGVSLGVSGRRIAGCEARGKRQFDRTSTHNFPSTAPNRHPRTWSYLNNLRGVCARLRVACRT